MEISDEVLVEEQIKTDSDNGKPGDKERLKWFGRPQIAEETRVQITDPLAYCSSLSREVIIWAL